MLRAKQRHTMQYPETHGHVMSSTAGLSEAAMRDTIVQFLNRITGQAQARAGKHIGACVAHAQWLACHMSPHVM